MHRDTRPLLTLQLLAGPAVLGSYAWSFGRHPELLGAMWGGVPEAVRSVYTAWMFVAAAGYLLVTALLLFRTDPDQATVLGRSYRILLPIYALILIPSALWMPLTGAMLEGPRPALWWPVVAGLWLTALGSLGLIGAAARTEPRWSGPWRTLAIVAAIAFSVQTIALDAIVWVWLFEPPGG